MQHCKLVVLVLSKEFFIASKWPMVELQEFMQSKKSGKNPQLHLMPLFFKVNAEDLSNPKNKLKWQNKWNFFAKRDGKRADLNEWNEALELLQSTQGVVFQQGMREEEYIHTIVERICEIVPPYITADLTYVQGAERICQEMIKTFDQLPCKETRLASDTRILAVYACSGMGKSTLCHIMCNYFRERHCRVCHIQAGARDLDLLALQKLALKQLTGAPNSLLEAITNSNEGESELKKRINKQQVFLAIDNVCTTQSSVDIARMFLRLGLTKESLVLVTACTYKDLLEVIGHDISGNCFHLPNLTAEEAIRILLERAIPNSSFASLPDLEQKIATYCTSRCQISCNIHGNSSTYEGQMGKRHYHPPSLIEKGAHLGGNSNNWGHKLLFSSYFSEQNDEVRRLPKKYVLTKWLECVLEHPEPPYSLSHIKLACLHRQFMVTRNS